MFIIIIIIVIILKGLEQLEIVTYMYTSVCHNIHLLKVTPYLVVWIGGLEM